jgi:enterochelin esterase-like enzyme
MNASASIADLAGHARGSMNRETDMFGSIEVSDPRLTPPGFTFLTAKSAALGGRADVTVYAPAAARAGGDAPIVILLHGARGSHWAWTYKGGAHQRLEALIEAGLAPPMVLVMPSDGLWGDGSGFVRHHEQDFERWVAEEAAQLAMAASPACSAWSPVFLCGLSMGGYAALRLAGKFPDRFAGASAHSAVTADDQFDPIIAEARGGWSSAPEDRSVLAALTLTSRPAPIRFDCGLDDPLLPANRRLHADLEAVGLGHRFEVRPGGHNWTYWSNSIDRSLLFFADLMADRP